MPLPRVLLADHNPWMAARVRALLQEAFDVVGIAGDGEELELAFYVLAPEVTVVAVGLAGSGALAAARRILKHHPDTPMVFVGAPAGSAVLRRTDVPEGAWSHVATEDVADELVSAVEAARRGQAYASGATRWTRTRDRRTATGGPRSTGWSAEPVPKLKQIKLKAVERRPGR